MNKKILRVLDANFNRLREGLRVVEEIFRLVKDRPGPARKIKTLRHRLTRCETALTGMGGKLISGRDSKRDPGRSPAYDRVKTRVGKKTLGDLYRANFKRCQEAARVLEEFAGLIKPGLVKTLKEIRFNLYDLEKQFVL